MYDKTCERHVTCILFHLPDRALSRISSHHYVRHLYGQTNAQERAMDSMPLWIHVSVLQGQSLLLGVCRRRTEAVIAGVVVLAYPLGASLQVVFASFVSTVALYQQTACRPFRNDLDLSSDLESYSLLVSLLTFISNQLFFPFVNSAKTRGRPSQRCAYESARFF